MSLPPVGTAFRWNVETWGHSLRCVPLEALAQHLFTTRQLGLPPEEAMWGSGEAARETECALAAASIGGGGMTVHRLAQVHGCGVIVVGDEATSPRRLVPPEADAQVSMRPDVILAVQAADCVPLLVADAGTGAIGAAHAGWRGTAAGMARVVVETMVHELGCHPADMTVAIGPSIGACCYQVGPEVQDAFRTAGWPEDALSRWFIADRDGRLRLDLWAANREQLSVTGVRSERVLTAGLCTQTHADTFHSYRAAGPSAGRNLALIRVR